jgi:hypothetical protein
MIIGKCIEGLGWVFNGWIFVLVFEVDDLLLEVTGCGMRVAGYGLSIVHA